MKQNLLLLGGFAGFAVCFATGVVAGNDIGQTLLNAAIGCMVGAFLFKWVAGLLLDCLAQRKRAIAADLAAEAKKEIATKGVVK